MASELMAEDLIDHTPYPGQPAGLEGHDWAVAMVRRASASSASSLRRPSRGWPPGAAHAAIVASGTLNTDPDGAPVTYLIWKLMKDPAGKEPLDARRRHLPVPCRR